MSEEKDKLLAEAIESLSLISNPEDAVASEVSAGSAVSPRKPGSGGARRGAGRPKKLQVALSKSSDPHDPVKTLKALKFDPIVECVDAIKEVDQKMRWMKKQPKPSMPAIAQLLNTKRALINDLLRFGYRPVPEKTVSELQFVPIDISLTDRPMSEIGIERLSFGDSELQDDLAGTKH